MKKRWAVALSLAGSLGFGSAALGQTTYTWNDPLGGNFHQANNWTPSGIPGTNDEVFFSLTASYTVDFSFNGLRTRVCDVTSGNVTFRYDTAFANHRFDFLRVGINSSNISRLTLRDMVSNPLTVGALGVGSNTGSPSLLNINNNGRCVVTGMSIIGFLNNAALNIETTGTSQLSSLTTTDMVIAYGANTSANITGTGAQLHVLGTLDVSPADDFTPTLGSILVSNGGLLAARNLNIGSSSVVRVQGSGSRAESLNGLIKVGVGLTPGVQGKIEVLQGGVFSTSSDVELATGNQSSNGHILVNGTNSTFEVTAPRDITVGKRGQGLFEVVNRGRLLGHDMVLGLEASSLGTLRVSDVNTFVQLGGSLIAGEAGEGRIHVENGALLLTTEQITVGRNSLGSMHALTGAAIRSDGGILGQTATGEGLVTINNSNWNAQGTRTLAIGPQGEGRLNIENRGIVSATNAYLGGTNTGTGTVLVRDTGSSLAITDTLALGGTLATPAGTGALTISGGSVTTDRLTLWPQGDVFLTGGLLRMNTLNNQGGQLHWNSGTVQFGQSTTVNSTLLSFLVGTPHILRDNQILASFTGTNLALASNLTLDGGRIQAEGSITINPTTQLLLQNGAEASWASTSLNRGTIHLNGFNTQLSGAVLENQGTIYGNGLINNSLNNTTGQVQVAPGQRLTLGAASNTNSGNIQLLGGILDIKGDIHNQPSGFISGNGTLMTATSNPGSLGLINQGVLAFSGSNTNVYGDIDNRAGGRIVTSGASVTTYYDDVTHNGNEIRTSNGSYSVFFGAVTGASPFTGTGTVQFEGDLRPGNSPANVQFAGDIELSVTARLVTEIGGLQPGSQYDRLTVQGLVTLGGQLEVALLNGFTPSVGDNFTIIDNVGNSPVMGTFIGLAEGSSFVSGGQLWNITYQGGTGNDVMLMAVPEPTTWALLGVSTLGAAGVWWYRRRQRMAMAEQAL